MAAMAEFNRHPVVQAGPISSIRLPDMIQNSRSQNSHD
jgi:hypothetical protein